MISPLYPVLSWAVTPGSCEFMLGKMVLLTQTYISSIFVRSLYCGIATSRLHHFHLPIRGRQCGPISESPHILQCFSAQMIFCKQTMSTHLNSLLFAGTRLPTMEPKALCIYSIKVNDTTWDDMGHTSC